MRFKQPLQTSRCVNGRKNEAIVFAYNFKLLLIYLLQSLHLSHGLF